MVSIPINTMNYRSWYHYSNHSGIRNYQHIGLTMVYSKWIMVLDYGHHQVVGFQPSPSLVMFMIGLWWLIGIGLPTLWNLVSYLTTGCPRWGRRKFGAKWSNDLWLGLLFLKKNSVLEWIPWTHKDRHLELGIVPFWPTIHAQDVLLYPCLSPKIQALHHFPLQSNMAGWEIHHKFPSYQPPLSLRISGYVWLAKDNPINHGYH